VEREAWRVAGSVVESMVSVTEENRTIVLFLMIIAMDDQPRAA
jgi:hypothetical protein